MQRPDSQNNCILNTLYRDISYKDVSQGFFIDIWEGNRRSATTEQMCYRCNIFMLCFVVTCSFKPNFSIKINVYCHVRFQLVENVKKI